MNLSARAKLNERSPVRLDEAPTRVLVVDDEAATRRALARVLLSRGMGVLTADDGASAIEVLGKESVDVALIDLIMPNVGGLELLEYIRAHHPGVEVIMMTAFGDVETAVKAVRAGGTKVWYLMAADEGHGFAKKKNADILFLSSILFFRENL